MGFVVAWIIGIVFVILPLIFGCCGDKPTTIKLADGKIITCKEEHYEHCGMRFQKCDDGVEHECTVNFSRVVEKQGPKPPPNP